MQKYLVTYLDKGFNQVLTLVSHSHYLEVLKPLILAIDELEGISEKKRKDWQKKKLSELKSQRKLYGHFFTDESPLWLGKNTGLCIGQVGKKEIFTEVIIEDV